MDEDLFRICFSWYKLIKKYLKPSEQDEAFDALREYLENGVDPVYRVRKSLRFPMALIIDQIVALREKYKNTPPEGEVYLTVIDSHVSAVLP